MNIHFAITKGPNKDKLQDAVGVFKRKNYNLFIVADGVGSAKHSDFGAEMTIQAGKKAIEEWRKLKRQDVKVLIQLIHFYWNLLIRDSEYEKKDCLSTCLFFYLDKSDNRIVLGQLGDGLIFFESKIGIINLKSTDDYNFTKALGSSKSYDDWNVRDFHLDDVSFSLLMTSDGVSEDLVENKEKVFINTLIKEISKLKKNKRNLYLKKLLENWPTKFHNDDKSICVAWEMKEK